MLRQNHYAQPLDSFRGAASFYTPPYKKEILCPRKLVGYCKKKSSLGSVHQSQEIGYEDAEELVQDSICIAAKLLDNCEKANKKVTPGNIACYTILHMKSGRRSHGSSNADALGTGTQLNGRSTTTSLDEPVDGAELGEEFSVSDVFSTDTAFCCEEILFVTQRHDGIERGCLVRGIEAKEDANR